MEELSKEAEYTYFRMDFEDWPEDFDYTICENLRQVGKMLKFAEIHLDDPFRKTKITITGVGMTRKQYTEIKKEMRNGKGIIKGGNIA